MTSWDFFSVQYSLCCTFFTNTHSPQDFISACFFTIWEIQKPQNSKYTKSKPWLADFNHLWNPIGSTAIKDRTGVITQSYHPSSEKATIPKRK